jgi:hypothetical protein
MKGLAVGFTNLNGAIPARGERVARYVDDYLASHRGLSLGELAFRLRVDKRDLGRLLRDRSCGWRLEDALAAYFGPTFVDEVFTPLFPSGRSIREIELERERAEIAARNERLERARQARSGAAPPSRAALRVADDEAGAAGL